MSASHIIQAGNTLFIGKILRYTKLVFRKEGYVYVLDLFVTVSAGATAPIQYQPMKGDAINQVANG